MTMPTNSRLGQVLRSIRREYLNGEYAKDVVARLQPMITEERGPSRQLSLSAYLRRETGEVDLELSTFLMVLSEAGIRLLLVDDEGRPLPPDFQLSTLPARKPTSVDFLAMAANLQREVDRLVTMAGTDDDLEPQSEEAPQGAE